MTSDYRPARSPSKSDPGCNIRIAVHHGAQTQPALDGDCRYFQTFDGSDLVAQIVGKGLKSVRVLLDEREIENGLAPCLRGRILRFEDDFHNSLERSDVAADRRPGNTH